MFQLRAAFGEDEEVRVEGCQVFGRPNEFYYLNADLRGGEGVARLEGEGGTHTKLAIREPAGA